MEHGADVRQVVAVNGQYLLELINFGSNFGVQVVTELDLVLVIDVTTSKVQVVENTTVR
tara:strand:- start:299 stop:475 length:177 start_codon:yes stop_codon:yes gene_type:complete